MEESINVRILVFDDHDQRNYWYRKILEYLRKALPNLIWRTKVNEIIDFGTQRWIFMTKHEWELKGCGYRHTPTYYTVLYSLETDFKETLITILKGE